MLTLLSPLHDISYSHIFSMRASRRRYFHVYTFAVFTLISMRCRFLMFTLLIISPP